MRLSVKNSMALWVIISAISQVNGYSSYQLKSDSEYLPHAPIRHAIPAATTLLSVYDLWQGGNVFNFTPLPGNEVLTEFISQGARIVLVGSVAVVVRAATLTLTNRREWPIQAVRVLRAQINDYAVLTSLRQEVLLSNTISLNNNSILGPMLIKDNAAERSESILATYREIIQAEFDVLQQFCSRVCDARTHAMIDALEFDFIAINDGALIGRDAVLAMTRGGATSFRRDIAGDALSTAMLGRYDSVVSPIAELYLNFDDISACMRREQVTPDVLEKAYALNEQLVCLCASFETAHQVKKAQFDNAVKHCMRITKAYHVYDSLDAARIYLTSVVTDLVGKK